MSLKTPIYLDNHATTQCDPRVVEAMMPYLTGTFGNAHNFTKTLGMRGDEAVNRLETLLRVSQLEHVKNC